MTVQELSAYRGPIYYAQFEANMGDRWVPNDIDEPSPEAVDEALEILARRYRLRNIRRGERVLDAALSAHSISDTQRIFRDSGIDIEG